MIIGQLVLEGKLKISYTMMLLTFIKSIWSISVYQITIENK